MNQIIEDAVKDPTLSSSINIEKLLEIDRDHHLQGLTHYSITKEIADILTDQPEIKNPLELCTKLLGYQYIDQVCDIRLGRFVRWVKQGDCKLHRGGIITNIQIEDSGVKILCQNVNMGFSRLKWEECILFQKLSLEEQMIININESL